MTTDERAANIRLAYKIFKEAVDSHPRNQALANSSIFLDTAIMWGREGLEQLANSPENQPVRYEEYEETGEI